MKLQASTVTVDEDGPITDIGFADQAYDTKEYVLLSYNREEPEEGVYIETNDQKWSGYGLIKTVRLLDSSAVIELTEKGGTPDENAVGLFIRGKLQAAFDCVTGARYGGRSSTGSLRGNPAEISDCFKAGYIKPGTHEPQ